MSKLYMSTEIVGRLHRVNFLRSFGIPIGRFSQFAHRDADQAEKVEAFTGALDQAYHSNSKSDKFTEMFEIARKFSETLKYLLRKTISFWP